ASVKAGSTSTVKWNGPAGPHDDVRVALPTAEGDQALRATMVSKGKEPILPRAPDQPGTYMVRYCSAKSRAILTAQHLRVEYHLFRRILPGLRRLPASVGPARGPCLIKAAARRMDWSRLERVRLATLGAKGKVAQRHDEEIERR